MSRKRSMGARLVADWPAKALSLAAAFLVFLFYHLNRLEERFVSVPLSVVQGEEYVPSTMLPRSARLTLKGEPGALVTILEEDLRVSVDLSGAKAEGIAHAPLTVERRGSALGVDPLEISIDPAEVTVNLERKATKIVPITPSFRGYLSPGYELSTFDLEPAQAEISGPAGAISRTIDLSTDFIELTGRTSDFEAEVRIFPKDPLITVAGKQLSRFRATVQEAIEYRRFDGVAVEIAGLAEGFALAEAPPLCSLRVQSSREQLRDFILPANAVTLDLSGIKRAGIYNLPLVARLPEGFAIDSVTPESVAIRVIPSPGGTR